MRLRWSRQARQDLVAIARYIGADNPRAARGWVQQLRIAAQSAAKMPLAGRMVPEFQRKDLREVLLRSYRIVYQVRAGVMEVVTVFEGHKRFPEGVVPQ